MRQIRRGVFETNSSSTHSVCISSERGQPLDYPSIVHFKCAYFGWEECRLESPDDKASYLYSSILALYGREEAETAKNRIFKFLAEEDIDCEFDLPVYYKYDGYVYLDNGGIDHAGEDEHVNFVENVLHSKKRLLRYLFSPHSYVLTGNDNEATDVSINADYPHEEYYKGN